MGIRERIANDPDLRRKIPRWLRRLVQRYYYDEKLDRLISKANMPLLDAEEISSYPAKVDIRLGIIKEFTGKHWPYIAACRDLGVPYRLLDISGPGWIEQVDLSGCDAFLVRPSAHLTVWKQMYDEKLRVMAYDMGKIIYPSYDEIWVYESKRRMHYWLDARKIPHPRTWVFYDCEAAVAFASQADMPIVYKSDLGAGASGVRIFRDRRALIRWVNRCFKKGIVRATSDLRDRQWGSVLFQEYLADSAEWRMIRLGRSFFGHQKLKVGDYHSGSGEVGWYTPPPKLLDFVRHVTELGHFSSMSMDVFETKDGRYLVNELQALFGSYLPYQMLVEGRAGRFVHGANGEEWHFEEGVFNQNGSCNLRIQDLLNRLGADVSWDTKAKGDLG